MLIVNIPRERFYQINRLVYQSLNIPRIAAEFGVLKGDNAAAILQEFCPERLFLVDAYSSDALVKVFTERQAHRPWTRSLTSLAGYFGGDVREQDTFDRLYATVARRYEGDKRVELIKGSSCNWLSNLPSGAITYAYIDASHQFEDVFDDLMACEQYAAENSLIQLNDCSCSMEGLRQNLGVLEAAARFVKLFNWQPILLGNSHGGDLLLSRRSGHLYNEYKKTLASEGERFVEVPPSSLPSASVTLGGNLSFRMVNE